MVAVCPEGFNASELRALLEERVGLVVGGDDTLVAQGEQIRGGDIIFGGGIVILTSSYHCGIGDCDAVVQLGTQQVLADRDGHVRAVSGVDLEVLFGLNEALLGIHVAHFDEEDDRAEVAGEGLAADLRQGCDGQLLGRSGLDVGRAQNYLWRLEGHARGAVVLEQ